MRFIDLSSNNSPQDFRRIKADGIKGGWIKVGGGNETRRGSLYVHRNFPNWARRMRAAGMRVGGYWFAVPLPGDAKLQAREFAGHLGKIERRDLRPALDFERNDFGLSNAERDAWAHEFSREFQRITGIFPLYYSFASFTRFTVPVGAGLWLANFSEANPPAPAPWKKYVAHQYTSRGRVNGINGFVDLSRAPRLRPLLAHPIIGLV